MSSEAPSLTFQVIFLVTGIFMVTITPLGNIHGPSLQAQHISGYTLILSGLRLIPKYFSLLVFLFCLTVLLPWWSDDPIIDMKMTPKNLFLICTITQGLAAIYGPGLLEAAGNALKAAILFALIFFGLNYIQEEQLNWLKDRYTEFRDSIHPVA